MKNTHVKQCVLLCFIIPILGNQCTVPGFHHERAKGARTHDSKLPTLHLTLTSPGQPGSSCLYSFIWFDFSFLILIPSQNMTRFFCFVCYVATQLATQLQQRCTQVVYSNKEARMRPTESNGTPAMDLGPWISIDVYICILFWSRHSRTQTYKQIRKRTKHTEKKIKKVFFSTDGSVPEIKFNCHMFERDPISVCDRILPRNIEHLSCVPDLSSRCISIENHEPYVLPTEGSWCCQQSARVVQQFVLV